MFTESSNPHRELIALQREDVYLELLIEDTADSPLREWLLGLQARLMERIRSAHRASAEAFCRCSISLRI